VICFPKDLKPYKDTIIRTYISTMRGPYGFLIGRDPITLFEAQESTCEIEENLDSSPLQEEGYLKETL